MVSNVNYQIEDVFVRVLFLKIHIFPVSLMMKKLLMTD